MYLVERIEIYPSKIPLKEPFIISLGLLDHAENVIVIIRCDNGLTGTGECSPFRTIHGESMETGMVVGSGLAEVLLGKNAADIPGCHSLMDQFIYGNSSIKSAFDMALYDIAAQAAGLPLYKYLGGANTKTMHTDYTVSIAPPEKMAFDAEKIFRAGFPVIKVKLGGTPEEDLLRIKLIREAVGHEIPLRIDANQGWTPDTALPLLQQLQAYNIQHCEEPIPRTAFMELPALRSGSPIPIMADESCCDHLDASRLIKLNACDSFNIKLGKSSGLFKAQKILALADQHGMKMQVGGFLESRVGFTASAHLALCSSNVIYYDFDTPLMFSEDPVVGGIHYGAVGLITMPEAPGLGASFAENYLENLYHEIIE